MGAERDAISRDEWIGGAGSLMTDGEWVWSVDLVYYLSRYHIALPADFLDHVRKSGYQAPRVPDDRSREIMAELFPRRLPPGHRPGKPPGPRCAQSRKYSMLLKLIHVGAKAVFS